MLLEGLQSVCIQFDIDSTVHLRQDLYEYKICTHKRLQYNIYGVISTTEQCQADFRIISWVVLNICFCLLASCVCMGSRKAIFL